MTRNVAVFGATGSIGTNTLDVISRHSGHFRASVLVADHNVEALAQLCARHQPDLAIMADTALEAELARRMASTGVRCEVTSGPDAIIRAAASGLCDTVVAAMTGAVGLDATLAAARAGKRLLLGNIELIVMAGPLLPQALTLGNGELIPLEPGLNAIFQCLAGPPHLNQIGLKRLILTASGGPFHGCRRADLMTVTPDHVCKQPTSAMGRKMSVDSATLMNTGREVIGAHYLFQALPSQIDVLVHPQRQGYSRVEYVDGSVLAPLGKPDVGTTISHALAWPDRIEADVGSLDLADHAALPFEKPDLVTFRCLALAFQALRAGGDAPAILNAANEIAVEAFLAGSLSFLSIADVIEQILAELPAQPVVDTQTLSERDRTAREAARRVLRNAC